MERTLFIATKEWEGGEEKAWDYEVGCNLLGIFSSVEKAREILQKKGYDEYDYELESVSIDKVEDFCLFSHHHMD
jgi:RNA-binding protein YlmH